MQTFVPCLPVPEGLKEVLWKEMNGAQVLGHRYFGKGHTKSDMGRTCPCGAEMSLSHILVGCAAYKLHPLMGVLLDSLKTAYPGSGFKTLAPDEWGMSPWYPLIALGELEELSYPITKDRKKILKKLKESRQKRIWIIGNYYWALWKWHMKEIHDAQFKFVPVLCAGSLQELLSRPVPLHLVAPRDGETANGATPTNNVVPSNALMADTLLPPLLGNHPKETKLPTRLSPRGKQILWAIVKPAQVQYHASLSKQDTILRALTDDAYT